MSSTLTALTEATTFATTDEGYAVVSGNSRSYTFATLGKLFGGGTLPFAVGTITTNQPMTLTQTWNNSGTTFQGLNINITNTASNQASSLLEVQVAGAYRFAVRPTNAVLIAAPTTTQPRIQVLMDSDSIARINFGLDASDFPSLSMGIGGATARDTFLYRDTSNAFAQRNSTAAQIFRLYRTYTDSANYERLALQTGSGYMEVAAETGGTGTDNLDVRLTPVGSGNVRLFAGTATPAAGSTTARMTLGSTAGFGIYIGSGAPTVSAAQGSLYLRSDGSTTSDRLYVNTNGSTTWTNVVTAA